MKSTAILKHDIRMMEENFTMGEPPKLGWPANYIEGYNGRSEAHIVEILTESVSDEYLGFLRKMEISYLFGGSDKLDLNLVAEKIREVLGAELLLVEGGGALNGSFMEAGLIDEMSLLLAPAADGSTKAPTLFESGPYLAQNDTNTTEDTNDETTGQNMETAGAESSSEDGSILIAYFSTALNSKGPC